jgi:MarR family transcriptional regulator, organic hydroperoxide resistance regulator
MAVVTHNTVPFLVQRVATLMNAWHADFRKLGLSVLSVRVMAVLSLNGGATVGELAEATSIDQSTLSHILRRLQRARLIAKTRQDHDNRSVKVSTTAKGRAIARKCHATSLNHDRMLTRGLPAAQVRILKAALHHLYANITSVSTAAPRRQASLRIR